MRYLNLIDTGWPVSNLIFIHEISGCLSQLKQQNWLSQLPLIAALLWITLGLNQLDTSVLVSQSIDTSTLVSNLYLYAIHPRSNASGLIGKSVSSELLVRIPAGTLYILSLDSW